MSDFSQLKRLSKTLKSLGTSTRLAQKVAAGVAPDLTGRARASFEGGQTAYDTVRPPGKSGAVSLRKTGKLFSTLLFVAIGTRVRAVLGVPYARYLLKFGILPRGGSKLPSAWVQAIKERAGAEIQKAIG